MPKSRKELLATVAAENMEYFVQLKERWEEDEEIEDEGRLEVVACKTYRDFREYMRLWPACDNMELMVDIDNQEPLFVSDFKIINGTIYMTAKREVV